jgi:CelD/BcsL family acetyltransferase involved in cellulose biosynthesis
MKEEIVVKRIDNKEAFIALRQEWGRLLEKSESNTIFLTWEWLFAWWQTYSGKKELWLLTVRESGVLIGIAPLMVKTLQKFSLKLRVLLCIGTPQSDIRGFITSKGEVAIEAISAYLKEHNEEWDILEIKALPQSALENKLLPQLFGKDNCRIIKEHNEHFYLSLSQSWDAYFKGLSKNLRRNLRRRLKRAKERGTVNYRLFKGNDLQWKHFLTTFEINEKGNYPKLYRSQKNRDFLRQLYNLMRTNGWLQIEILFIEEKAVAFQCGYNYDKIYLDWRGSYDIEFESLGVGKLLMMFSLERRYQDNFKEIDFLRGTHSYKADWKPLRRGFVNMRIFQAQRIKPFMAYQWLANIRPYLRRMKRGFENGFFIK